MYDDHLVNKVAFDEGNRLILSFKDFNKHYGVTIKIEQEKKEDQFLSFEFKIRHIKTSFKSAVLEIKRFNLKINHQEPNYAIDELAYKCGNIIYPLRVFVDEELKVLSVENHQEIIMRWKLLKNEIEKKEITEAMQWYLDETEKSMINLKTIENNIKQDLFLSALFVPIHTQYIFLHNNVKKQITIPLVPHSKPIQFHVQQQAQKEYTTFNTITVTQKGRITDPRSAYEIATRSMIGMGNGERPIGTLEAIYQLEKDTKVIDVIIANYTIELPYKESRKIELQAFSIKEEEKLN